MVKLDRNEFLLPLYRNPVPLPLIEIYTRQKKRGRIEVPLPDPADKHEGL